MSGKAQNIAAFTFILIILNSAYLLAFKSPTLTYMGNVLLHLALGLLLIPLAIILLWKQRAAMVALVLFLVAGAIGVYLMIHGNLRKDELVLYAHILAAGLSAAAILPFLARRSQPLFRAAVASLALLVLVPTCAAGYRHYFPDPRDRITNSLLVPASMEEEGGGTKSPFWPSSTQTNVQHPVPANFFLDSAKCGECHKEVYEQWKHSVHHFASFNNQFYRRAIEYMQDTQHSTKPSQWCAGCHDHAVIFSGKWQRPIKDQIDTPEAQAGLGCISCHAISKVDGSMGNGGFIMEYNPLHDLAASDNKYIHAIDTFLTYVNPEPHRRVFLKPFMTKDTSEFCSSCHKVHLDIPVNNYRWVRGFNDYDNWQASGVSGQGARSFYYPSKPSGCPDCHMPEFKSDEPGNVNGKIHSHYFAAANTAVPVANNDQEQLKRVEDFLKSGFMRVDIFAASPVEDHGELQMKRTSSEGPALSSTFAVGEEAEQHGQAFLRDVDKIAAPLDRGDRVFAPGSTVRVDVVVRTLKIGHFFPAGTVDSQEAWLELQGKDATGRTIFWSGKTAEEGKGPVDPSAHFYQSIQLDADGNVINRRNAFQTRSLLYVRLIPPGAADVAHYRVHIPKDAKGPITLTARLNYRKFTDYYTKYVYAGQPKPGQDPTLVDVNHDSREWGFDPKNIPANVSGEVKDHIPDLPIVTIAASTTQLNVAGGQASPWVPIVDKRDRERWNDYGVGLLLQGDLKGAEFAFQKVIAADPAYSDGHLNVARALIQEGEIERAKPYVTEAMKLNPGAARNYYFLALAQKTDGDYDGALKSLETAAAMYPRDRVVLNQIARIQFLKRDYKSAVDSLHRVLMVDPEDVQCHYNLMLCLRALGRVDEAQREEQLFLRFKADESSQAITGKVRQLSPELNNSRQPIHDHESAPLTPASQKVQPAEHRDSITKVDRNAGLR
ncbi:MAG: tetratricopeptide repeat protein [Bryobacteraceae bacterium]